jgi:hypothetical protein
MRKLLLAACFVGLMCCIAGHVRAAAPSAAPDSLRLRGIQALLDELGMGYSRAEMEATLLGKVRQGLGRQDSILAAAAEPHLAAVVDAAFDGRAAEVAALQNRVNQPLLAAFSDREIRELTVTFRSEPVRRLLRALQGQDDAVQGEGARLFNALGRDVQVLLKAKLTVEGILPPAGAPPTAPPAPTGMAPPLLQAPRTPPARRTP